MDSAGATQLHGIPGVFGALAAGIVVIASTNNQLVNYYVSHWVEEDILPEGCSEHGYQLSIEIFETRLRE